ncbi:MAG: potassium channel family protein [Candidatus Bathyarchaeia archaeon]
MSRENKLIRRIKKGLVEIKNTSELMIDLAYSALIFDSKEIAEEVQRLEEYVDKLHTKFERDVLSKERVAEQADEFLSLIRLSIAAENIADAAAQIAETVLRGIEPHPILTVVVNEAEETVTKVEVAKDSILAGKTLEDLDLPNEIGMRIIAIRRKRKWLYSPSGRSRIEPMDTLIARGYAEGKPVLEGLAAGRIREL